LLKCRFSKPMASSNVDQVIAIAVNQLFIVQINGIFQIILISSKLGSPSDCGVRYSLI